MIPLACVQDAAYIWDPACNRDLASISTNYIDPGQYLGPGFYLKFYGSTGSTINIAP